LVKTALPNEGREKTHMEMAPRKGRATQFVVSGKKKEARKGTNRGMTGKKRKGGSLGKKGRHTGG